MQEAEVFEIQLDRAVFLQIDDVVEDLPRVHWLAVRREPHHLVLSRVHLESGELREGGVEQSERVREAHLLQQLYAASLPPANAGRRPLADAVDGEDGRGVERRGVEAARGMRAMVNPLKKETVVLQGLADQPGEMQLHPQP